MNTVSNIRPDLRSLKCPALLRPLQAWVMWRFEQDPDDPKGKPRKVPYYASGARRVGRQGTAEDRIQLVTFDAAVSAAARKGMEGVGLCPLEGMDIIALDFDDCLENGELVDEVEKITVGTYAEFSPSGNGIRVFFKGDARLGNRKSHKRKGWPYGFETFSTKGFVTFTGNVTPVTELCETEDVVAELTPQVLALYEQRFGAKDRGPVQPANYDTPPVGLSRSQIGRCMAVLDPGMGYDEWIEVGMALHHETRGEGFDIWDEWSSTWPDYPGTEALRSHWDSMGHRSSGRVVTARSLVKKANDLGERILLAMASAEDFDEIADEDPEEAPGADTGDFDVIEAPAPKVKKQRFELVSVADFLQRPLPKWMIKGLLPQAQLAVLFGEPGSGKSFIALELAMCLALGVPWRGLKVRRSRTVYIVAEGAGAFGLRLKAFCQVHGIDPRELDGWLMLIAGAPNLMEKDDVLDVSKRIREWSGKDGVGAVFVDTFARTTPGANENSGEDMGKALFHCDGIHRATGGMVILVHHAGKDASKGARGHSSIKAAADAELEISKTHGVRHLRVTKSKDGDDNQSWPFDLDVVQVGVDEDGDPVTSCVVREMDASAAQQARQHRRKYGDKEQLVVDAFEELLEDSGEASAPLVDVVEKALEQLVARSDPLTSKQKSNARTNLRRALEGLCTDDAAPFQLDDEGRVHPC